MTEINGLDERIADLKRYYQEAERLNLNNKAIELLVDINYLEELRELRSKQEPCEDVVSRKTIDQNIYDYAESNGLSYANLKNAILDAPSVKIAQRWIPVDEELPEESTAVLVWCPERKNIYCAYREVNQWWIFGAYFEKVTLKVTAWKPLPQPYKVERKEIENGSN